jgi:hypothetical protein
MAYRVTVDIEGVAPLSQSRQHPTDYLDGESNDAYDKRTWREKCNSDDKGIVFVPAMAFKQAMDVAAKRLAIPDPDNKRANFTKYFVSDVLPECNMSIGIHKDAMPSVTISANVDGVRGSGKRVPRTFPQTPTWKGRMSFIVMEEKITPEIFLRVIKSAGQSIGVGQFRPEKGGINGRFNVSNMRVEKL